MSRSVFGLILALALIATCASTVLASAQVMSSPTEVNSQVLASSSPVAYVYVSSSPSSGKNQINAYSAASNGTLTSVTGSPFSSTVQQMAVNGAWLFGTDGINIDSFSIASNGSLTLKDTLVAGTTYGGPGNLFLDHTGANLYDGYYNLQGTGNNGYQAYSINQSTGKITFINDVGSSTVFGSVLSFVGNNEYAYSSSCYHFTPEIFGFKRNSGGSLSELNITPPYPSAPAGDFYCPYLAAADPNTYLAVPMVLLNGNWVQQGPYQLAAYTVSSTGDLSTTNTNSNMPSVAVGTVTSLAMSPSGKYLAVGGTSGLQIFHFNGASPITKYTGDLLSKEVDQIFWDNANHLYAIGRAAGKLWVYTVTSTSVTQASGSPHAITNPEGLIVLPKT
jgi:hypothetical protein